jgi:deoxyxylulose-5-phosphate synthase
VTVKRLGLPDAFVPHGSLNDLFNYIKLDLNNLVNTVLEYVKRLKKE